MLKEIVAMVGRIVVIVGLIVETLMVKSFKSMAGMASIFTGVILIMVFRT